MLCDEELLMEKSAITSKTLWQSMAIPPLFVIKKYKVETAGTADVISNENERPNMYDSAPNTEKTARGFCLVNVQLRSKATIEPIKVEF